MGKSSKIILIYAFNVLLVDNNQKLDISDDETVDNPMRILASEYVRPEWMTVVLGIFGSILSRILDLVPPLLLAIALDSIILNEKPFDILFVPDRLLPTNNEGQLITVLVLIVMSFVFAAVFHWIRNWGWNALAQRVQDDIRTDAYDSIQRLGMPFFANHQTGEMMSVLSNDANQLERFLNEGLNSFFRLIVMVIGVSVILFYLNWKLALIALIPIPLLVVFTIVFINIIQPKYESVRSAVGSLNSRLENNIGGMRIIKVSTTEDYESQRVSEESKSYLSAQWGAIKTRIKFFPALRLVSGLGFALTFAVGAYWVVFGAPLFFTGSLTPGVFVLFILYTQRFIWPVAQFGQVINKYQRARASARRLLSLIHQRPNVVSPDDPERLGDVVGKVEYEGVSFSYENTERIIKDISFESSPGDTVALVGPTGAGKSTIIKLLLRMYDTDSGSVQIDGTNIKDLNPEDVRGSIGYVSQDPFLFDGSVADNVDYGVFESERDDIIESAKVAEAHGFISNLPDGYDTEVGERGVKLSGGQRQRIAIARAVLHNPSIMILDEATSDVDTETEVLIQRSLNQITEQKTTFVIAHRLSTIKDADKILVIEDGSIVEQGKHEQLLNMDGLYANLWRVQSGEIEKVSDEFVQKAMKRRNVTDNFKNDKE